jgi:hypothetical protein
MTRIGATITGREGAFFLESCASAGKARNPMPETIPTKGREHAKAFGVSNVQNRIKLETDLETMAPG